MAGAHLSVRLLNTASAHGREDGRAPARPGDLYRGDRRFGLLTAAPATLAVLALVGVPAVQTIWYSLQDKKSFDRPGAFVGLDNYVRVINSPNFQHSLSITIQYALGFLVVSTVAGLLFALLLNEPYRFRGVGRTLLIVPWAAPWLMVGIMWKWFIDADVGALNGFLYQVGLIDHYIPFLAEPTWALVFAIIAAAWRQASFTGLLFLAALQTIPSELPEAAKVDGANAWQRFRFITLPWLRSVLLVVLVTNLIFGFLQFDVLFIMTQGGPGNATNLLSLYLYRVLFNITDVGAGSAIAVIIGCIAFGIGLLFVRYLYRTEPVMGTQGRV